MTTFTANCCWTCDLSGIFRTVNRGEASWASWGEIHLSEGINMAFLATGKPMFFCFISNHVYCFSVLNILNQFESSKFGHPVLICRYMLDICQKMLPIAQNRSQLRLLPKPRTTLSEALSQRIPVLGRTFLQIHTCIPAPSKGRQIESRK